MVFQLATKTSRPLFADDVVLMANRTVLKIYTISSMGWHHLVCSGGLVVNTDKTDIMIFNKAGILIFETFTYNKITV